MYEKVGIQMLNVYVQLKKILVFFLFTLATIDNVISSSLFLK